MYQNTTQNLNVRQKINFPILLPSVSLRHSSHMNVNIVSLLESSVSKNVSLVSACILSHVRPRTGRQILYPEPPGKPCGSMVKNPIHLSMQEMQVQSLGQKDPLEKEMATHASILAWEIPWTEEPGGLQSMRSQRVEYDLAKKQQQYILTIAKITLQEDRIWVYLTQYLAILEEMNIYEEKLLDQILTTMN